MTTPPTDPIQTIHRALQALAGVCDYAQAKDDCGFNAFDAGFGHQLASQPTITPRQAESALKMLRKYVRQLEGYGITLPETFVPEKVPPKVTVEGMSIFIAFGSKPNEEIRAWLKSIPGWHWHIERQDAAWSIPYNSKNVQAIHDRLGVDHLPMPVVPATPPVQPQLPTTPGDKKPINTTPASGVNLEASVVFDIAPDGAILVYFPNWKGRKDRVEKIKTLDERRWLPDDPGTPWRVPVRFVSQLVTMFPEAEGIEKVSSAAKAQAELKAMSNKATGATIKIEGLTGELYPFQHVGLEFLEKAKGRALIGDEMGLGKTIQAIAYMALHPEKRPVLVVCPASLKLNWRYEINRWMVTRERIAIVEGNKPYDLALTGATIVIINYDILSRWVETIVKWNPAIVVVDEAHYCKNRKAQRSKAVESVAAKIPHTIFLTGTPVTNCPAELFPLLHMIAPKDWPSFWRYAEKYCGAYNNGFGWQVGGASNLEKLHEEIKGYVIRRTKTQVLKELPPKQWSNLLVEFDSKLQDEYNQAAYKAAHLAASAGSAEKLVLIELMKQITAKAKLPGLIDWVTDFIENGEKLVIFATHTEIISALQKAFGTACVTITGATPNAQRQEIVQRFQQDPNILVFIGNIKAAGVGLTLTAASNVLFAEFPWTPGDLVQAADRCHRIGQTDTVNVYMAVSDDTIDMDITALLEEKRKIIDVIHDGQVGTEVQFGILDELVARIISKSRQEV